MILFAAEVDQCGMWMELLYYLSSTSHTVKFSASLTRCAYFQRNLAKRVWKVPLLSCDVLSLPISFVSHSHISFATLLVNVTVQMENGGRR